MSNNARLQQFKLEHGDVLANVRRANLVVVKRASTDTPFAEALLPYAHKLFDLTDGAFDTNEMIDRLNGLVNQVTISYRLYEQNTPDISQRELIEGAAALKLMVTFDQLLRRDGAYERFELGDLAKTELKQALAIDDDAQALAEARPTSV